MRDPLQFGPKTFAYFDGAKKHAKDRAWFDRHSTLYTEWVELPLTHLVSGLSGALSQALSGVGFAPRKITTPIMRRPKNSDGPVVRENATAYFSEPATSMFETNPGIYISLGAKPDDNVMGCGIYMPSARQMRELRAQFDLQASVLRSILKSKSLRAHWDGLSGERYIRYPKGFVQSSPGSEYFWHKQFFLGKQFTRKQVCSAVFIDEAIEALGAALPFLTWTREVVGVYRKPKSQEG